MPLSFRLTTIFYVMALLAAALTAFGAWGSLAATLVLAVWMFVWTNRMTAGEGISLLGIVFLLVAILLPVPLSRRSPSTWTVCKNNLRQLSIALRNYHDAYGSFPPPYLTDAQGKPAHSWRVLLLPYIEEQSLYNQYRFDEPWNGPNNSKLVSFMPEVFRCPGNTRKNAQFTADYLAVVGEHMAWTSRRSRTISDFLDGHSNTIQILESCGNAVNWMEPRDLTFDQALQQLTTASYGGHRGYYSECNACFLDGHAMSIWPYERVDVATAVLTIDGGESVDEVDLFGEADELLRVRKDSNYSKYLRYFPHALFIALAILPAFRLNRPRSRTPARGSSPP